MIDLRIQNKDMEANGLNTCTLPLLNGACGRKVAGAVRASPPYLALLGRVTNGHLDERVWVAVYFLPRLSEKRK